MFLSFGKVKVLKNTMWTRVSVSFPIRLFMLFFYILCRFVVLYHCRFNSHLNLFKPQSVQHFLRYLTLGGGWQKYYIHINNICVNFGYSFAYCRGFTRISCDWFKYFPYCEGIIICKHKKTFFHWPQNLMGG